MRTLQIVCFSIAVLSGCGDAEVEVAAPSQDVVSAVDASLEMGTSEAVKKVGDSKEFAHFADDGTVTSAEYEESVAASRKCFEDATKREGILAEIKTPPQKTASGLMDWGIGGQNVNGSMDRANAIQVMCQNAVADVRTAFVLVNFPRGEELVDQARQYLQCVQRAGKEPVDANLLARFAAFSAVASVTARPTDKLVDLAPTYGFHFSSDELTSVSEAWVIDCMNQVPALFQK